MDDLEFTYTDRFGNGVTFTLDMPGVCIDIDASDGRPTVSVYIPSDVWESAVTAMQGPHNVVTGPTAMSEQGLMD